MPCCRLPACAPRFEANIHAALLALCPLPWIATASIRITGGAEPGHGKVLVQHPTTGKWGTINGLMGFDDVAATVACKQVQAALNCENHDASF